MNAKKCRSRTSLKSGTIMENSIVFSNLVQNHVLMSVTKKGFSSQRNPKTIGIKEV